MGLHIATLLVLTLLVIVKLFVAIVELQIVLLVGHLVKLYF